MAKAEKGDFEGAIVDCTKAIELQPDDAQAYNNRGIAKAKKGDLNGEIADCTKAIELQPNFAQAYFNRGNAKNQIGDPAGGKADIAKASDLELARKQFKAKAIQLHPVNAEVKNSRDIVEKN